MEHLKIGLIIFMLFLCLIIPIANAENNNLILNPSLEQGIGSPDHWFAGANTYWSNEGHSGIHSIGLTGEGDWRSKAFNVSGNAQYHFEFWVKGVYYSGEFYVYVRWFSDPDASSFISQVPFRIMGNYSNWVCVNDTLTAPANAMTCDIFFRAEPGASGDILVDDFLMYEIVEEDPAPILWFNQLFYGTGKWLTLIIMMAIIIAVCSKFPLGGTLFLPITIFLGFDYLRNVPSNNEFIWGALMMICTSIFILVMAIRKAMRD